jgi:Leucine-rich repeat (LRR) protein
LVALNGLSDLTVMCMTDNMIIEILPVIFESLSNLNNLYFFINNLQQLDSGTFIGLFNILSMYLSLTKLQYIHPDTFLALRYIESISIYDNPHLQIPTDRPFIKSHSLSHLDISYCKFSSLSVETFTNVSALERLDLIVNNLRSVVINILTALPKLSTFHLHDNPLQCDCQLKDVWRWCEGRNITTVIWGEVPKCDRPSGVKGWNWGVLEELQCLQGNVSIEGDYKNRSFGYTDIDETSKYTDTDKCTEDTYAYKDTKTDRETDMNKDTSFLTKYQLPL